MFSLLLASSSDRLLIKSPLVQPPCIGSRLFTFKALDYKKVPYQRRNRNVKCRAELSQDAPFAIAIGACILNSLAFPISTSTDDESGSAIDASDARFAVMGIISFIPYFNWLSWVFAWMDTGRRRYLVYSIVYLIPYLRTNLSLSPEDSWLPVASIIFCIIHVQLEASIRNGDLEGIQLFGEALKKLSSVTKKKDAHFQDHRIPKKARRKDHKDLPSAQERSRDKIQGWEVPRQPSEDARHLNNEHDDANESRKD